MAGWTGRGRHRITLPSGFRPLIKLPDLSDMIRNDLLPENLRAAALRQAFDDLEIAAPMGGDASADEKAKAELERYQTAKDMVRLLDALLLGMIIEPQIDLEQLGQIPGEDRDMLVAIAQRQRGTDALGVRIGVAPLDAFEKFRGLHGCVDREPEGCEACKALQQTFSTVDVGGL